MPASLYAHHAVTAEFDQNKPITFKGTIKPVEWANPHIYTQVEVKEADGKTVVYRVEGAAPNSLFRQGWRPDTLKPGDVVTVSGIRSKSETRRTSAWRRSPPPTARSSSLPGRGLLPGSG